MTEAGKEWFEYLKTIRKIKKRLKNISSYLTFCADGDVMLSKTETGYILRRLRLIEKHLEIENDH